MFGQTRPIIVDEANVVLCGNGLTTAMIELGMTTINALRKTGLTENQKKKLMIADNKTASLGLDDLDVLMQFINEMSDDLDIPGYDSAILESMVSEAEDITEELSNFGILSPEEVQQLQKEGERKENRIETLQKQPQSFVTQPPINPNMNTGYYQNVNADQGMANNGHVDNNVNNVNNVSNMNNDIIYPTQENTYGSSYGSNVNIPETTGELRKSVVCPKCGEIIWL